MRDGIFTEDRLASAFSDNELQGEKLDFDFDVTGVWRRQTAVWKFGTYLLIACRTSESRPSTTHRLAVGALTPVYCLIGMEIALSPTFSTVN
jgi:hypothetical protein